MSSAHPAGVPAAKPLFRDPVYDGAADPVLLWHRAEQKWLLYYTNRRANVPGLAGFSWVHGTRIGVAESTDGGANWRYRGVADIDYGGGDVSHWAPEILWHAGRYHMYLSVVPGIHEDWSGQRFIVHLTSDDAFRWHYQSTLPLVSDRVIDACVLRMPNGVWRLWYKDEVTNNSIWLAESDDLYTWRQAGQVIGDHPGEGPKVFHFAGRYWMIVDQWRGIAVYHSPDGAAWTPQPRRVLATPGAGEDDQVMGGHADVVVSGERAFCFYFTHPGRRGAGKDQDTTEQRRTSIQVVELTVTEGELVAMRDEVTYVWLEPPTSG